MLGPIAEDPEFRALRRYSARLGRDASVVQGPGGNTSLKRDGVLWVKASGTWLAQAETRDIFVPVALEPMLAALRDSAPEAAEDVQPFVVAALDPNRLRPSIETTMHAALPRRVVVHVHCVDTMAWAAREDAETALAPLLAGFDWAFVPYVRPGAPLTRAILERTTPKTDVLVLGSHGLVVGGSDVQDASERLQAVRERLRRQARRAPTPRTAEMPGYRPPADPATHAIALDPASLAVARRGSLYPDHVIFLGPGIAEDAAARPRMLVRPGVGVLLREDASPAAIALARCLADVAARLDPAEPIRVLRAEDEAALLGWDAEKYRQALDRPGAAA